MENPDQQPGGEAERNIQRIVAAFTARLEGPAPEGGRAASENHVRSVIDRLIARAEGRARRYLASLPQPQIERNNEFGYREKRERLYGFLAEEPRVGPRPIPISRYYRQPQPSLEEIEEDAIIMRSLRTRGGRGNVIRVARATLRDEIAREEPGSAKAEFKRQLARALQKLDKKRIRKNAAERASQHNYQTTGVPECHYADANSIDHGCSQHQAYGIGDGSGKARENPPGTNNGTPDSHNCQTRGGGI